MRKVAFFIGSLVSEFQSRATTVIAQAAHGKFSLDVFSNVGSNAGNYFYRNGEETVIDIPNLADYDGIIVSPDSLSQDGLYEQLVKKLNAEATCPIVATRCRDDNYHNILIDDDGAMRLIITHLMDVHGMTRISFMTGRMDLEDARIRLNSYKKVMAERGIEVTEHMVFEGDYWRGRGEEAVNWFLGGDERPEAIVCSNDYMALSVVTALNNRGIRVPEDIAVTGFDNIDEVRIFEPRIASMDVPVESLGKAAVDVLIRLMDGEEVPKDTYVSVKPCFEGSCGCPVTSRANVCRELYDQNSYLANAITQTTYMNNDYENCISIDEVLTSAFRYAFNFAYDRIFYCQCDGIEESMDDSDNFEEENRSFKITNRMILKGIMNHDDGTFESCNTPFDKRSIIPEELRIEGEPLITLILRSRNRSIGYLVVRTEHVDKLELFFLVWMQGLAVAIDRVCMLNRNNEYLRFKQESRLDPLTGLYNRREMENILRRRRTGKSLSQFYIMVLDLDGLKYINDTYGHSVGDEAICAMSNILKEIYSDTIKAARTGGDEFTLCIVGDSDDVPNNTRDAIREKINAVNATGKYPFELSASIGYAKFHRSAGIAHCLNEADRKMYEEKATKKNARK